MTKIGKINTQKMKKLKHLEEAQKKADQHNKNIIDKFLTKPAEKKAAVHEGEYQVLDLAKIKPSKFNYRKIYKKDYIEELTQSVKDKGVLEPICVRPAGKDFEVVFGNCRWLASINAKLSKIPAIIKHLSDEDALEAQIIENSHRDDPNPMDEAWGFKKLLEMGKHTPQTLAERLGKTLQYIYGRLKLLDLSKKVQDLIAEEKISAGHAVVLTRLRDHKKQEDIAAEIVRDGCNVRDTAQAVKQCSAKLTEALFDTAKCAKCECNTDNQALLFPDVKKTGECTDTNCYHTKTKAHFEGRVKELNAKGFKVITSEKEADALRYHSRTAEEIFPPEHKDSYRTKPKKYKTECMNCVEHHRFYFFEKKEWDNSKKIYSGEICLNKMCLDSMNGRNVRSESGNGSSDSGGTPEYKLKEHARNCRDRFLRATLPAKVEKSEPLRLRLMIYNLLKEYGSEEMEALVKQFNPKYKYKQYAGGKEIYAFVLGIPVDMLSEAAHKILIATIQETDPEVLLRMTLEAGIAMMKDFGPDEEFLNSKTKDELVKFVSSHKLAVEVKETDKKSDIVKAILTQDLKGKLPKECVEVCKI